MSEFTILRRYTSKILNILDKNNFTQDFYFLLFFVQRQIAWIGIQNINYVMIASRFQESPLRQFLYCESIEGKMLTWISLWHRNDASRITIIYSNYTCRK